MDKRHLLVVCSIGLAVALVSFTRWRNKKEKRKLLKKRNQGSVNIGGIFGMDVGGTLTKIVYFEAKLSNHNHHPSRTTDRSGTEEIPRSPRLINSPMMRSNSFGSLVEPDHQAALHQLYTNLSEFDKQAEHSSYVRDGVLSFYSSILEGRIHFLHFETRNMLNAIKLLEASGVTEHIRTIGCTGGGAHKYARMFEEELNITFKQLDELGSLIKGMNFALTNVKDECYTYREAIDGNESQPPAVSPVKTSNDSSTGPINEVTASSPDKPLGPPRSAPSTPTAARTSDKGHSSGSSSRVWRQRNAKQYTRLVSLPHETFTQSTLFPYLVVNIGSGVSILKVMSSTNYERVSGSSLGGGTYWGLCRLLTKCQSYEEVLDMAENGDSANIDMLVGDIYGGGYDGMNLSATMVASSFGKLVMKEHPHDGIKEEDLALALLMMITNNIGQVAYLNARLHGCSKIFFVGSFLRHNSISCKRLAYSIDFWSKGAMEALFLAHEGYFGALGTFLQEAFGENVDKVLALCAAASDEEDKVSSTQNTNTALMYASKGKESVTGNNANGAIAEARDSSDQQGKSTVYGLDSDLLRRIRTWRPLSFSAFVKSKSKREKSQDDASREIANSIPPMESIALPPAILGDAAAVLQNGNVQVRAGPSDDSIHSSSVRNNGASSVESRKRSDSLSAATTIINSRKSSGREFDHSDLASIKSVGNEISAGLRKVEDFFPVTSSLNTCPTPEFEAVTDRAAAEHQEWITLAQQQLVGQRNNSNSQIASFGRSSRTMSENAALRRAREIEIDTDDSNDSNPTEVDQSCTSGSEVVSFRVTFDVEPVGRGTSREIRGLEGTSMPAPYEEQSDAGPRRRLGSI